MLTYRSTLTSNPPSREIDAASASQSMRTPVYAAYNQNHRDVLAALGGDSAARFNMEAEKANSDYRLAQLQAQRQLALSGLQQMAEAQQNQNALANTRLQNMTGFAGGLLKGLFN